MADASAPTGVPKRRWASALVIAPVALVVLASAMLVGYRIGGQQEQSAILPSTPPVSTSAANNPVTATLAPHPIDVGFAQDMMDHHDQAVQMALLAISNATTQSVRTMAVRVATDQRREMGILNQFLRDRGITQVDPTRVVMAWMNEPMPHDKMPGLATSAQMVALTNAQGVDVDRLFIELMIAHHEGGVHMAQYAAARAESPFIRDLAARMATAQNHEISDLRQLTEAPG